MLWQPVIISSYTTFAKLAQMLSRERHPESIAKSDQRLPDLILEEDDYGHTYVEQAAAQNER